MNRRDFLARSLALPLGVGLFRGPEDARPPAGDALIGPVKYVGLWRSGIGTGAQWSLPASSWSAFAAEDLKHFNNGLRLVTLDSYYDHSLKEVRYVGTWRDGVGTGAQQTIQATGWEGFWAAHQENYGKQMRLVAVSVNNHGGGNLSYTGTWRGGVGLASQKVQPAVKWNEFAVDAKKWFDMGGRMVAVSNSTAADGEPVYMAVWSTGLGTPAEWTAPAEDLNAFTARSSAHYAQGLRLAALNVFYLKNQPRYFGVWRGGMGTAPQPMGSLVEWSVFAPQNHSRFSNGLRLTSLSVLRDQTVQID